MNRQGAKGAKRERKEVHLTDALPEVGETSRVICPEMLSFANPTRFIDIAALARDPGTSRPRDFGSHLLKKNPLRESFAVVAPSRFPCSTCRARAPLLLETSNVQELSTFNFQLVTPGLSGRSR
jgi:hypothetical protein